MKFRTGEYVLLMGNDYVHKGVRDADRVPGHGLAVGCAGWQARARCPQTFAAWGAAKLTRQHLRELFADARVVVYPSHYEGFGLPVIDALALGKARGGFG